MDNEDSIFTPDAEDFLYSNTGKNDSSSPWYSGLLTTGAGLGIAALQPRQKQVNYAPLIIGGALLVGVLVAVGLVFKK